MVEKETKNILCNMLLKTKNGKIMGNAYCYATNVINNQTVYLIETDYGNKAKLTNEELHKLFWVDEEDKGIPRTYNFWLQERKRPCTESCCEQLEAEKKELQAQLAAFDIKVPDTDLCDEAERFADGVRGGIDDYCSETSGPSAHSTKAIRVLTNATRFITRLVKEVKEHNRANRVSRNLLELSRGNYEQLQAENDTLRKIANIKDPEQHFEQIMEANKELEKQLAAKDKALENKIENCCETCDHAQQIMSEATTRHCPFDSLRHSINDCCGRFYIEALGEKGNDAKTD